MPINENIVTKENTRSSLPPTKRSCLLCNHLEIDAPEQADFDPNWCTVFESPWWQEEHDDEEVVASICSSYWPKTCSDLKTDAILLFLDELIAHEVKEVHPEEMPIYLL